MISMTVSLYFGESYTLRQENRHISFLHFSFVMKDRSQAVCQNVTWDIWFVNA